MFGVAGSLGMFGTTRLKCLRWFKPRQIRKFVSSFDDNLSKQKKTHIYPTWTKTLEKKNKKQPTKRDAEKPLAPKMAPVVALRCFEVRLCATWLEMELQVRRSWKGRGLPISWGDF